MTTLHQVVLSKDSGVVSLFSAATPPIESGVAGYIQNISAADVYLSDSIDFDSKLLISGKQRAATSILSFGAGDTVFLKTNAQRAVLTVAIDS